MEKIVKSEHTPALVLVEVQEILFVKEHLNESKK
jgi:hypothetical protein